MKFFGIQINIKRQPGPGPRLTLIEESIESHKVVLNSLIDRLGYVEKKAEATRRKVYRDGEGEAPVTDPPSDPPVEQAALGPGDPIPSNYQF